MKADRKGPYRLFFKRFFDVIISFFVLLLMSPLLLILAVLVRIKLGSPVIFSQKRPGLDGKIFTLYKFRTMTDECGDDGELLPDEVRLTSFGRLLRSTSLDELPEFFNILKGDMSLIGPRPLLVSYLPLYNAQQSRRHEVRPGLSGLAQVSGRNLLSWEDRFALDVQYVDTVTLAVDMKIVFSTVANVLKREGINGEGSATMEPFTGSAAEKSADAVTK